MTWSFTRISDRSYVCEGMCAARVCNPPWHGPNTGPGLPRCPVIQDYVVRHSVKETEDVPVEHDHHAG
jgi:hypothetical protein